MPTDYYAKLNTDQAKLNSDYSDYTEAYLSYVTCLNNNMDKNGKYPSSSTTRGSGTSLSTTQYDSPVCDASFTAFNNKQSTILTDISKVSADLDAINNSNIPGYDKTISDATIKSQYANLVSKRSNLDLQLQQLYNLQNTAPNTYETQLDSTVYSGILWTVLATSLIYYVFTKL
jgi:hypothetical protein